MYNLTAMKQLRHQFLTILLLVSCIQLKAQKQESNSATSRYNNNIQLELANILAKNWGFMSYFPVLNQIGISYNKRIYKGIHLGLGFSKWSKFGSTSSASNTRYATMLYGPNFGNIDIPPGSITEMANYKMVDLYAFYKFQLTKRQSLNIGGGAFYATGLTSYIDYIYINPEPGDAVRAFYTEKVDYWGAMPQIAYNYTFFNGRLNVGMHLRLRFYQDLNYTPRDHGIQVGFNF